MLLRSFYVSLKLNQYFCRYYYIWMLVNNLKKFESSTLTKCWSLLNYLLKYGTSLLQNFRIKKDVKYNMEFMFCLSLYTLDIF